MSESESESGRVSECECERGRGPSRIFLSQTRPRLLESTHVELRRVSAN